MSKLLKGEGVVEAYRIVKDYAHRTPVLTCDTINKAAGAKLLFKCENFQKVGAFKFRGAIHSVVKMMEKNPTIDSFCTHSSGNHAQAVALAGKMYKKKTYIVMPNNALKCKVDAVRGYDANIIFSEANPLSRETLCEKVQSEQKAQFIHPSDEPLVILGAGTSMYEFYHQSKEDYGTVLDAVLMPVGGGGLASGTGLCAKHLDKNIKVYGGEPVAANDAFRSFKSKKHVKNTPGVKPKTIADGLLTNLGPNTFHVITNYFDDIFTVTDEEIVEAMFLIWTRMKIVIEPSSAVPVAVALFNEDFKKLGIKNLGIILSGGNIDLTQFFEYIKTKMNQ